MTHNVAALFSREGLKFYPWTSFLSYLFYQSTALSSLAVNGHQMYFGGLFVGKASSIGIEISPTPPLIFTVVKKWEIGVVFNITQIRAACVWKCSKISERWIKTSCVGMAALFPRRVWYGSVYAPLRTVRQSCPTAKIARQRCLIVNQPWMIRLRSNFV